MASPRVYVETSVISYLTARPSRDLLIAARQEATREWWEKRNASFLPLISTLVLQEAANGDPIRKPLCVALSFVVRWLD